MHCEKKYQLLSEVNYLPLMYIEIFSNPHIIIQYTCTQKIKPSYKLYGVQERKKDFFLE